MLKRVLRSVAAVAITTAGGGIVMGLAATPASADEMPTPIVTTLETTPTPVVTTPAPCEVPTTTTTTTTTTALVAVATTPATPTPCEITPAPVTTSSSPTPTPTSTPTKSAESEPPIKIVAPIKIIAPGRPAVTARASESSIIVTWKAGAAGSGIKGFTATARPGPATCAVGPDVQGCVLGAKAGRKYTVLVVARGAQGKTSVASKSAVVTPVLPEIPAKPSRADAALTATGGDLGKVEPGQRITFVGKGFAPYSSVRLASYPKAAALGTKEADRTGIVRLAGTMPRTAGEHTVTAYGIGVEGQPYTLAMKVTVAGPELPVTGPPAGSMLAVAVALLAGGVIIRSAAREPRRI